MVDHTDEHSRDAASPWRKLQKTAQWQRLRWDILIRDDFTCRSCGFEHPLTCDAIALKALGRSDLIKGKAPDMVVDHIRPHKGDAALFWGPGNLQCLCKACHDTIKQRQDRRAEREGGV
ncbi:HNH endonuclease [Pararhodobacter zhoushanensis]|uniref:HNH endonuclease n=1 Tax=Pararhodobacter zhoushanensis TaxID=2479545 RepID=UPI001C707EF3|nr:HNH endonuclease signature motif containing protein [Pararhodobacter zhoushanensis]